MSNVEMCCDMQIKMSSAFQTECDIDCMIAEAEAEFKKDGELYDAHEALALLRQRYFG